MRSPRGSFVIASRHSMRPTHHTLCLLFAMASVELGLSSAQAAEQPRMRGIAETRSGEKHEGWIRMAGTKMIVDLVNGGGSKEIGASELKVAHMHLAGTPKPQQSLPGLRGKYFPRAEFGGTPITRIDPVVNFGWGGGSPMGGFPADNFTVRWEGEVEAPVSGNYQFHTSSNDGARLWVDGRNIIDRWIGQMETEHSGTIQLQAGRRYALRLEHFEGQRAAAMKLLWTPPGGAKSIIPKGHLWHSPATATRHAANGLNGAYFKNRNLQGNPIERTDPRVDFHWDRGGHPPGIPRENFSVRWTGAIEGPVNGKITFTTRTDDGVRLWVGGRKLIDQWRDMAATEHRGDFEMKAGARYPIRIEYFQGASLAEAQLFWNGPSLNRQIIPSSRLFASTSGSGGSDTGVHLKGGTFLAGIIRGVDKRNVELTTTENETLRIPRLYVSALQFARIDPGMRSRMKTSEPGSLLWNGDYFPSELVSIDTEKARLTSILFGPRTLKRSQVRFVKFDDFVKTGKAAFEVRTKSGSRIRALEIALDGKNAAVKDGSRYRIKLAPEDVTSVFGIGD